MPLLKKQDDDGDDTLDELIQNKARIEELPSDDEESYVRRR